MSAHTPTLDSGAMAQATLPETKHTPGPWRDIGDGYVEAGSAPLKFRSGWYDSAYLTSEAREEWQANAALIARAPDLLAENERLREALQVALEQMLGRRGVAQAWDAVQIARAALSEQEGK